MPVSSSRIHCCLPPALAAAAFAVLVSCGGGGGASASIATPAPAPQTGVNAEVRTNDAPLTNESITDTAPPEAPINNPPQPQYFNLTAIKPTTGITYRDKPEFKYNWGLAAINADAAYCHGYWGENAIVGIVDSGVRVSHQDLSVNITPGRAFDPNGMTITGADEDPSGHGTHVAGIVGGAMDAARFHGVAPSASIMPLRIEDDNNTLSGKSSSAFAYAAANNVHILNNSWEEPPLKLTGKCQSSSCPGTTTANYTFQMPWTEAALAALPGGDDVRARALDIAAAVNDADIAVVFAAGNAYWNGKESTTRLCAGGFSNDGGCQSNTIHMDAESIVEDFVINTITDGAKLPAPITMSAPITKTIDGKQTTLRWESSSPNVHALVPLWNSTVRGRWLAVVATDKNNTLAGFSNGCGEKAKHWCLAAPGVDIVSGHNANNTATIALHGTSMSAPHVSGALALLKSRFPGTPMSVLVHILLTTAKDLGEEGVDDVYGHGLVDISAAILVQGSINVALSSSSSKNVLLQQTNTELPPSFSGFAKRLNGIGIAANYLDNFYYDMPLDEMIKTNDKKPLALNFAAGLFEDDATMNEYGVFAFSQDGELKAAGWQGGAFQLRHNFYKQPSLWQNKGGDINHRPFFADNGGHSNEVLVDIGNDFQLFATRGEEEKAEYSQMGISWHRQLSSMPKLRLAAAHSYIKEDETLLGGKFGGLMPLTDGGDIRQTDIGLSYALDSRWRLFGGYQRADINAKFGGIVGDMSGVVAEGWNSGFSATDWLRKGDNFRIGIGRQTSITRGDMLLKINQSSNPQQDESTQAMHNRSYEMREQQISLADDAPLFLNIGYAFAPGDNSQLAIALNYQQESESALSIDWRWNF